MQPKPYPELPSLVARSVTEKALRKAPGSAGVNGHSLERLRHSSGDPEGY